MIKLKTRFYKDLLETKFKFSKIVNTNTIFFEYYLVLNHVQPYFKVSNVRFPPSRYVTSRIRKT